VSAIGTLTRTSGASSAQNINPRDYLVTFNRDVSGCAHEATLGDTGSAGPPLGFIGVASGDTTVLGSVGLQDVYVRTWNGGGALSDEPFHLAVFC